MVYAQKLIDKYPDIITGYYQKGRALETENKLEEAVAVYLFALGCKINCEYYQAETYEHLALSNTKLNNKETAANYASKALAIHNQYWIPDHLKDRIKALEEMSRK